MTQHARADIINVPFDFHGGIRIPGYKDSDTLLPIRILPTPHIISLPLTERDTRLLPTVQSGAVVRCGTIIAQDTTGKYHCHATIAGRVHYEKNVDTITVSHHPDAKIDDALLPIIDPDTATPDALHAHIRAAGIVGLGGAGFPTAEKLQTSTDTPIDTLIINGVECEPFIACDMALMTTEASTIVQGGLLCARMIGAQRIIFTVEADTPNALDAVHRAVGATDSGTVECICMRVPCKCPSGSERQLITRVTGIHLPAGALPHTVGILMCNVGTIHAVYNAVYDRQSLISRVTTVCGDACAEPMNIRAPIGTPFHVIADYAGIDALEETVCIVGGGMMGTQVSHDSVLCKTHNCIQFIRAHTFAERFRAHEVPCIRCGACSDACPEKLLPQQLYWHSKSEQHNLIDTDALFACIECGVCDYVCPSHIPLVHYFRFAKDHIRFERMQKSAAQTAKSRYEFREERLVRDKQEREESMRKARENMARIMQEKKNNTAVKDALARVRAKKEKPH